MILIFEGCDGAGKTTLLQLVQQNLQKRAIKTQSYAAFKGPSEDAYHYTMAVYRAADRFDGVTLLDRSHHSELVYGPLLRKASAHTLAQHRFFELFLMRTGCMVIWCHALSDEIRLRLSRRKQPSSFDAWVDAHVLEVLARYKEVWCLSRLPHLFWCSSFDELQTTFSNVGSLANQNLADAADFIADHHGLSENRDLRKLYGIGYPFFPKLAIVGDRFPRFHQLPRPGDPRWLEPLYSERLPFDRGRSAAFLTESLWWALAQAREPEGYPTPVNGVLDLRSVYLTNSAKDHLVEGAAQRALAQELDEVKPEKILALGEHAARRLGELRIPALTLEHPQHWLRFRYRAKSDYGRLLGEAIDA